MAETDGYRHLPDVLIILDTPEAVAERYQADFTLLLLRPGATGFTLHTQDGAVLELAPQAALAIVAPSASLMEGVRGWAKDQLLECPVVTHADGVDAVLRHLANQRRAIARQSTALRLQLAELRMAHATLQAHHATLTALLRDQGLVLPRPGFSLSPDPLGAHIATAVAQITQPIPVDIRTLCGVAVHLGHDHPPTSLSVHLLATDDDRPVAAWDLPELALSAGWTSFVFPLHPLLEAGTAALRLRWHGSCPPLSLARPTLRADRAASIDGVTIDRSLALRAFVTAPGAGLAVTQEMGRVVRLDGAPIGRIDIRLDGALTVVDTRRLYEHFDFHPVAVLADHRHILVHPLGHTPTAALLPALCPRGTREVVAQVETVHPDADPIEYAILVVPPDTPADNAALDELAAGLNWLLLPPCQTAQLRVELPADLPEPADLLLLTRVLEGGSSSYGWARFTGIALFGRFDAD